MTEHNVSRRRVLKGVAAGAAATGMTGEAAAERQRHIVGLRPGIDTEVATQRARSVHRELDFGDIGTAVAGRFSAEALDRLRSKRDVRYVEKDSTYHALAETLPWGVDRVDAEVAHSNGDTGNGADIAIIDTGIDDDHPDLEANVGAGKAYVACSGSNCNYDWSDDNDHGTHCAGTADGVDNSEGVIGVSTEATLHAVKVLDDQGSGSLSDVAAGIEYVADRGWDVGSLSLGASSGDQTLKDACTYAYDNGVLLVAAAGNDGPCSDCVGYPAAYSECIAVSATTKDDNLSGFSSTGPEVELAAPGGASDGNDSTSIYSTVIGGYDYFNGTSMATPHVSGAGGQLMANGYSNTDARSQLQSTAEDIGLGDNEQGYGLLDTAAALGYDSSDDLGGDDGGSSDCVDASNWPDGTGYAGYEHITDTDMDGQVVVSTSDNAYYDLTCDGKVQVSQGGSFTVSVDFEDNGYDDHYGNVFVDWDQNQDWSTATETRIFESVNDDTVTYEATVDVPSDAPTGQTLARLRLSWGSFYGPTATDEYGEVQDFTIEVQ
ncbi:S8 family peptidase [Halorussus salinisoli]|uniref:S8 family peptidase n=1 Tax=Halorussus salinisoli TaxID=2558242 RepID=UPI0010C1D27E|nr:S8 family peptidase [Halorussus salinisoli]